MTKFKSWSGQERTNQTCSAGSVSKITRYKAPGAPLTYFTDRGGGGGGVRGIFLGPKLFLAKRDVLGYMKDAMIFFGS